jgi:hypothetical protein
MSSSINMAEYMKNYRLKNKEYYEKEKKAYNDKYNNDLEYKEAKKKKALDRYYKLKAQKEQLSLD